MVFLKGWVVGGLLVAGLLFAAEPRFLHPALPYGGVVALPDAAEQPRAAARLVFDITAETPADVPNKGLEGVARYLNLHVQAGLPLESLQVALVLHGGATQAALADEAFARRQAGAANPNTDLLRRLKQAHVQLYVCGQSLARSGIESADVNADLTVALSAMTVLVNKQQDGHAYLTVR